MDCKERAAFASVRTTPPHLCGGLGGQVRTAPGGSIIMGRGQEVLTGWSLSEIVW